MRFQPDTELVTRARQVAAGALRAHAAEVDRDRAFPQANFAALHEASLLALLVPRELGGGEARSDTFVEVMEALGGACASTGMCFLMHSVATAIVAAGGTPEQRERWLRPLVHSKCVATQAVSEPGTGSHFYIPEMGTRIDGDQVVIEGVKRFVTNGKHADWYLVYLRASPGAAGTNWVLIEGNAPGLSFEGEWDGMGMAGNSSVIMRCREVRVPRSHIIGGEEGKGEGLLFGASATTFVLGLSALNIGIAQSALDFAVQHAKRRSHSGAGGAIGGHQAIRFYLSEMYAAVAGARCYLHHAVERNLAQAADALQALFTAKVMCCEASMKVTNLALQIAGGQGYQRALPVERWFRDARAGAVMGPTNELMKDWVGKLLLEMPLV
jgi:alkylation response protein AidB-like acyl-CoA dehydrogenase